MSNIIDFPINLSKMSLRDRHLVTDIGNMGSVATWDEISQHIKGDYLTSDKSVSYDVFCSEIKKIITKIRRK